jgi:Ca2+-binding EF-hand superfamily protein
MLQLLDQDGDGALSREEFVDTPRPGGMGNSDLAQRNRELHFDQLDANGDGRLTRDELADMPAGMMP